MASRVTRRETCRGRWVVVGTTSRLMLHRRDSRPHGSTFPEIRWPRRMRPLAALQPGKPAGGQLQAIRHQSRCAWFCRPARAPPPAAPTSPGSNQPRARSALGGEQLPHQRLERSTQPVLHGHAEALLPRAARGAGAGRRTPGFRIHLVSPPELPVGRDGHGVLDDLVVQERNAHLQRHGHGRAVHLGQDVVGQVAAHVGVELALQTGEAPVAASASSARYVPEGVAAGERSSAAGEYSAAPLGTSQNASQRACSRSAGRRSPRRSASPC
jgi:hypothetical protein